MTHVIYPTTNLKATEQLVIDRGEGAYVYDDQGKRYLEGLAGLWCTSLGYGNQELIDTVQEQLSRLSYSHMFGGKTHPQGMALADKLAEMVPMDDAHVFFGNSGSDANDTHIKMLRYYFNAIGKPEKRKIITRERAYHGVTVAAGCLTSLPVNVNHFDAPLDAVGILRTDHPHYFSGRQGNESEAEFVNRITNNLEELILREGPETIAAFICEPVTGASGVIVPPAGYYEKVQAILNKYDILFWADEVITGFGRLGADFGSNAMGIQKPDMMSFAKQLSSAYYPISASVIRSDMHAAIAEQSAKAGVFGHGYTYSGHPVACAVALKTLEIYERDNLFAHAATLGDYLQNKLAQFKDHALVGEVRGKGMIGAIEMSANKATGEAFADGSVGAYAIARCQEHGLILRAVAGNSLAVCPPLIIDESHVDEICDIVGRVLDETLEFAQGNNLLKG
ncbi:aminotransferase class III-fold pyridoxal phosphate-dependent enzyme [Pseudomaricurvus alkylphenolicus]|uniref:aminotransferase n=1 Tax=Pseudomaricurvus alkylphenolicus TaxID=1306991 RepID=UPI0014223BE6|nr:aminotransferase class III-fold pyridoxal phosphate-dependent enzyme [Pseudomaricurvus alkylphenolicus]